MAARSRGEDVRAEKKNSSERVAASGYVERLIDAGFGERRGIRVGATPLNTVTRAQINRWTLRKRAGGNE